MDGWIIVIGCLGFTTLIIAPFVVNKIIKFKLEIARINAETTVKAEEIRSRNQIELEKFLQHEENEKSKTITGDLSDGEIHENPNRSRVRI